MTLNKADYKGNSLRYLMELPENGLLFNTVDVLKILQITDRPAGSDLARPCLDLTSAVNVALGTNQDFAMWLNESFVGFAAETIVHPDCDDEWVFS